MFDPAGGDAVLVAARSGSVSDSTRSLIAGGSAARSIHRWREKLHAWVGRRDRELAGVISGGENRVARARKVLALCRPE